jgi:type VI secretion system secreted protein VgrG
LTARSFSLNGTLVAQLRMSFPGAALAAPIVGPEAVMGIPFQVSSQPFNVTAKALDNVKLVALRFRAKEAISQLFRATVDVAVTRDVEVPFDKILCTPILIELATPTSDNRYFHGICSRISQSGSDDKRNYFSFELVPEVWLRTKVVRSRIFQQDNVKQILIKILGGFPMGEWNLREYEPRDYCVQYRESDWNFAARLMEEEGIYFYFQHAADGHKIVLADASAGQHNVPFAPKITYKTVNHAAVQTEDFIYEFAKSQELTSERVTLWDHTFELPHKHLEARKSIKPNVNVGNVEHTLKITADRYLDVLLESYDWPGQYSHRFTGVDPGGGDQSANLDKIFPDAERTAGVRMEELAAGAVECHGAGTCRQLMAGHKFELQTLSTDPIGRGLKPDGSYVVTSVSHTAVMSDGIGAGGGGAFSYQNSFTAIPLDLPFRPARVTPRPVVPGSQTAVVVGPEHEEIFTDRYGRVKIQFHWDREGKNDADSSCWVRIAAPWAGRGWGMTHIPRRGQEVIVDFLEGDPDRPIIVGSVHNPTQMPAYKLPEHKTRSWLKSSSSPGGEGFNEIRFEDKKDHEQIFMHAQGDMDTRVNGESRTSVGGNFHFTVGSADDEGNDTPSDFRELVHGDKDLHVKGFQNEWIEGSYRLTIGKGSSKREDPGFFLIQVENNRGEWVGGESHLHVVNDRRELVGGDDHRHVAGNARVLVEKDDDRHVKGDQVETIAGHAHKQADQIILHTAKGLLCRAGHNFLVGAGQEIVMEADQAITLKTATVAIEATDRISLKVGGNLVDIGPAGVSIVGTVVKINSGGSAISAPSINYPDIDVATDPTDPNEISYDHTDPIAPTPADNSVTGHKSNDD